MATNGIELNGGALKSNALAMELLKTPEKRPKTYGGALEMCRMAKGWSRNDLMNRAVRGATKAQIAKWELGDEFPPPRFAELIRKFLPLMRDFDDKLPVHLREEPAARRNRQAAPQPAQEPVVEGWRGPKPANFGEALKTCREMAAMNQGDVGTCIGVHNSTVTRWEKMQTSAGGDFRMVEEVYQKLCDLFPMLRFAPKPPMSTYYTNQKKTEKYIETQQALGNVARAEKIAKDAVRAHVLESAPKPVDTAPANHAGAAFGLAAAHVATLKRKRQRLIDEHTTAITRIDIELQAAEEDKIKAEEAMERTVDEVHGSEART